MVAKHLFFFCFVLKGRDGASAFPFVTFRDAPQGTFSLRLPSFHSFPLSDMKPLGFVPEQYAPNEKGRGRRDCEGFLLSFLFFFCAGVLASTAARAALLQNVNCGRSGTSGKILGAVFPFFRSTSAIVLFAVWRSRFSFYLPCFFPPSPLPGIVDALMQIESSVIPKGGKCHFRSETTRFIYDRICAFLFVRLFVFCFCRCFQRGKRKYRRCSPRS